MRETGIPALSKRQSLFEWGAHAQQELWMLALLLFAGLIHGFVYVFLMPPWQHYDEPTHFEYAALIAKTRSLPDNGDFDLALRREIFDSMVAHDFYKGLPLPDREKLDQSVLGLRYVQLDESPFYYLLASLPVWLLRNAEVTTRLYGARLVSLGLLLVSILGVWGMLRELTRPGNPLRTLVPLTVALLPGFVDLMTAVNNDVAATAVFSLFLWACVRILRRGLTPGRVFWVALSTISCLLTKSTVFIALPLGLMALLLAGLQGRNGRLIGMFLLIGSVVGALALLSWKDASFWYLSNSQPSASRIRTQWAPAGDYALSLDAGAVVTPDWLRPIYQPLPLEDVIRLQGRTVTLGVWMWVSQPAGSAQPINLQSPVLTDGDHSFFQNVSVSETPAFFAFTARVPQEARRMWITLAPLGKEMRDISVFFDGFVLAPGAFPTTQPPVFTSVNGEQGDWGGRSFQNLIRNPSGEGAWPTFRPSIDSLGARILPDNAHPSMLLNSLLDWRGAGWYYELAGQNMLQTFWAKFGWGHVPLIGTFSYPLLGAITALGFIGAMFFSARQRKVLPLDVVLFLALVFLGLWGAALLRGTIFIFVKNLFIPAARYAYPGIAVTVLLLVTGWMELLRVLRGWLRFPTPVQTVVYLLGFLILDIVSLISILRFYERI